MPRFLRWETTFHTQARTGIRQRTGDPFARETIAVLCLSVALLCAGGKAFAQDDNGVLDRAREAALAARTGLQTGSATGTYRKYDADGKLLDKVRFCGMFDGEKQYLHLQFLPAHNGEAPYDHKRIIVQDGSATFVSCFSKNITKTGAVGRVYSKPSLVSATGTIAHPIKLIVRGVFPLDGIEEFDVQIQELPNGHYRGAYVVPSGNHMTFEVAPEKGYNAVSCTALAGPQGEQNGQKFFADWKEEGGRWYANHFVEEVYRKGKLAWRTVIDLDEFRPNVPVKPELFTLSALELPDGSRILDQRHSGKVPVYRKQGYKAKSAEAQSKQVIEQIEAMPRLHETQEVTGKSGTRIWGVAFGLLGIVLIAVVWFIHHRRGG